MQQVFAFIGLVIVLPKTNVAHSGVSIQMFLNTDIQPAVLFIYDDKIKYPAKIPNRHKNTHLISALRLQDFLPFSFANNSSKRQNPPSFCNDFHTLPFYPELVIIEMTRTLHLHRIFQKISICLSSTGWKPAFIINYHLEQPLLEHIEYLKRLVMVSPGISVNCQLYIVIDSVTTNESSMNSSDDASSGRNKTVSDVTSTVWEIYAIKNLPIIQQVRFQCQAEISSRLDILAQLNAKSTRSNFFKAPILGAAENSPEFPLDSILETVNGKVRFVSGFSVDLFHNLEFTLNFSAKAVQGEGWLSKDEVTSKWMGTGRQIMAGDVDIGISMTLQYEGRADFALLMPTYGGRVRAFFHQPDSTSIRDIFKHAFSPIVWIVMVAVFVFSFLTLKLMIHCKIRLSGKCPRDAELAIDSALFVIASICQQGWHMHPKSTCLKIIFLCCAISGFVMYVSLSAALVSTLTNEIIPIRTVVDLLESGLSLIGDKYIPIVMSKLESIYKIGHVALLARKIAFDSAIINPTLRIAQEPCAYLGFTDDFVSTLRMANKSERYYCETISNVKLTTNRLQSGMVVRKDSPFREYFNYGIIKNIERGLNWAHRERYVRRSRVKCDERITTYREDLEVGDVFSAYVVLAIGLTSSIVLASVERYFFFINPNNPLAFRQ